MKYHHEFRADVSGLAPWAKAGPPPVLVKSFVGIPAMPIHWLILSSHFWGTVAELSSFNRNHMASQPKIDTIWPFTENAPFTTGIKPLALCWANRNLYYLLELQWFDCRLRKAFFSSTCAVSDCFFWFHRTLTFFEIPLTYNTILVSGLKHNNSIFVNVVKCSPP